jgi:Plasmid pRiA4b ORF-3-like protein
MSKTSTPKIIESRLPASHPTPQTLCYPIMAQRLGWYRPEQLILKITLAGSEPKIWRRVEVHSGLTLDDLHFVIQNIFEWENSHLYQFWVPPGGKLTRTAMRDAVRYHGMPPDPIFDDDEMKDGRADEALIGRIFNEDHPLMVYEYDFGDSWHHLVKLEKRTPGGDQDHIPVCLAGENPAPLDDMGGIPGYYMWLDALRDPSHEMHDEAIDWFGEDFLSEGFDLAKVNKRLSAAFKPAPKKRRKKPK